MDLYTEVNKFLEPRTSRIEEWQDLARMLITFLKDEKGFEGPFNCKPPERTGIGSYMYVVRIGLMNWFVYDDEAGIAHFTRHKPNPAGYS